MLGSTPLLLKADVQFSDQPLSAIQEVAKTSNTPYFVYVYQEKDRQCRRMERKTWRDEELATYIDKNFLAIKLDAHSAQTDVHWINEYEVYHYPAVLFFAPDGQLLGKADGFIASQTLNSMLKKHIVELNQKEEVRLWVIHYQENEDPAGQAVYYASNTLSADEGIAEGHLSDLATNLADLKIENNFPTELPASRQIVASNESFSNMKTRGLAPINSVASEARENAQIILEVPGLERFSLANYGQSRGDESVPMNYALLVGSFTAYNELEMQLDRFQRYWQDDVWVYCEEVNKTPVYKLLVGPYIDQESAETFAHAMYKFQKINPTVLNIEHLKQ
ncbi:MAG: thioredoxin family protein [Bacteroidota bacterium]